MMENQPRDESRAAAVREGGAESWPEAGEFIDQPARLPTAAGSRTPTDLPTRDSPTSGSASGSSPRAQSGQAGTQSRSPWLPFLLLPIALWLRERGKAGAQASEQILEPLELDRRSRRLARQGGDMLEDYSQRWIRQVDPTAQHGWGWTPFL